MNETVTAENKIRNLTLVVVIHLIATVKQPCSYGVTLTQLYIF